MIGLVSTIDIRPHTTANISALTLIDKLSQMHEIMLQHEKEVFRKAKDWKTFEKSLTIIGCGNLKYAIASTAALRLPNFAFHLECNCKG